jgi:hypothetical protein
VDFFKWTVDGFSIMCAVRTSEAFCVISERQLLFSVRISWHKKKMFIAYPINWRMQLLFIHEIQFLMNLFFNWRLLSSACNATCCNRVYWHSEDLAASIIRVVLLRPLLPQTWRNRQYLCSLIFLKTVMSYKFLRYMNCLGDESNRFLWTICILLPGYAALHFRR